MKLYAIGCSFTHGHQLNGPTGGWPQIVADKLNATLTNYGCSGAGNTYISRHLQINLIKPDLALVMWSGLTRKDVLIDHTYRPLVSALNNYSYIAPATDTTSYLFSGGMRGSWENNNLTKEIFIPLYKISNERTMAEETILNILQLQSYFKLHNIKYIMSSYVNYWNNQERVADLDFGIKQFADLLHLVDQIDFSCWVFTKEHDCIYELAQRTPNGLQPDKFHPTYIVHEQWANLVLKTLE